MDVEKLRRDFDLPEEDREHLDARGLPWETVSEGNNQWLLIHDFPIPEGYKLVGGINKLIRVPNRQEQTRGSPEPIE